MVRWASALLWCVFLGLQLPNLGSYLSALSQVENYGWLLPILAGLAALAIFGLRWDLVPRIPTGISSPMAVVGGGVLAFLSRYNEENWLAFLGLFLSCYAFMASQRDRQGYSLGNIGMILLCLLIPPWNFFAELQSLFASYMAGATANLLRFFQIPHIAYEQTIQLSGVELDATSFVYGLVSWPMFVFVASLHSVLFRRSLLILAFNLGLSIACYLLFSVASLVTVAWLADQGMPTSLNSVGLLSTIAMLCYFVFASCERALLTVFASVPDGIDDAPNANPIVVAWNRFFSPFMDRNRAGKNNNKFLVILQNALVPTSTVIILLGWVLARGSNRDPAAQYEFGAQLGQAIWSDGNVKHQSFELWGSNAETWTKYHPSRVSRLSIAQSQSRWSPLPDSVSYRGWEVVELDEIPELPAYVSTATFERDKEQLFVLQAELRDENSQNSDASQIFLRSQTHFSAEPNAAELELLANEFEEFFQAAISKIDSIKS